VRQYVAELHRYLNIGEPRPQSQQQKRKPIGPIHTDKLLPLAPPPPPAGRQLRLRSVPKRTLQVDTDTDDDDVFVFTHASSKQKKTPKGKRRKKTDDSDWAIYRRRK